MNPSPTPSVSWLIPVKDGMPYLRETLASIASQSFTNHQVLVWLTESHDGSAEELARWIPGRLPGRVFTSGPIPLGAARRELVNRAESEFGACIDADDVNEPTRLATQVAFLRARPEISLVASALTVIDLTGRPNGRIFDYPLHHTDIVNGLLTHNTIPQPAAVFRLDAIRAAGNYDAGAIIEDYDLWLRLCVRHRLANLPDCLVRYRWREGSYTRAQEAQNLINQRMDHTFVQNSTAVFGLAPERANRLRTWQERRTIVAAFVIARHLARTQGGTTWRHLRIPSFGEAMRRLTRKQDLISLAAYHILEARPGVYRRALRTIAWRAGEIPKRLFRHAQ